MKTVCPNCHQKYDVPDDYLQQEVTCEKCQHDFFVTKAKFCPECGKANPNQSFQCHSCQHSFQTPALRTAGPYMQSPVADANDRSGAKLSFLMNFIVALGTFSYALAVLNGIIMTVKHALAVILEKPSIVDFIAIVGGICAIFICGRLSMLLFTLYQPYKKAVQTPYAQVALYGAVLVSLVGTILSITVEGYHVGVMVIYLIGLLCMCKIIPLWNVRCIMDEDYEESEEAAAKSHNLLGRIGIILGVIGVIPGGGLLSIPAMIIGIITSHRSKAGTVSMWLGIIGFLGHLVLIAFLMKNS